ncbi:DUF3060 domain-containing protein [Mycobacterium sp.]|uniref:DUF3060 domain-containing protein n=1 Tax=Mycobacterium sp. TaxID=1785 RepID=UPI003C75B32C
MRWTLGCRALAACAIAIPFTVAAPTVHAKNGDTHVTGEGLEQTIDCNGATLIVDGTRNVVNALGSCWAVTVMGSGHTVVADNVVHDIIVYGYNESVFYKSGQPVVWDRGRELGMTNRISQVAG